MVEHSGLLGSKRVWRGGAPRGKMTKELTDGVTKVMKDQPMGVKIHNLLDSWEMRCRLHHIVYFDNFVNGDNVRRYTMMKFVSSPRRYLYMTTTMTYGIGNGKSAMATEGV